jgi:outer membrane protein OmpA-like peptidoglycan-associated protein
MKKKITNCFIVTNILLLTGCKFWQKKKPIEPEKEIVIIEDAGGIRGNACNTIEFDNVDNVYNIIESKSIFSDDDSDLTVDNDDIESDGSDKGTIESTTNQTIKNATSYNSVKVEDIENAKKHIGTVQFAFNVYKNVRSEFQAELDQIVSIINAMVNINPDLKVIIEGHACNSEGSERYNIELSNKRAVSMKDYIINKTGIKEENISVFGCGTSHLIVYGDRYQQSPNRRSEIFVI